MLQLYFIRHGQSENNVVIEEVARDEYLFHRVVDPALTPPGKLQADLVAEYLARPAAPDSKDVQNRHGFGLTHLYCSLMTRAVQTAVPIGAQVGLPLVAMPEAHETGGVFTTEKRNGEPVMIGLPGHGRSYFEEHFPTLVLPDDLSEEGWWNREKEPRENYSVRAGIVVDRLLEAHAHSNDRVGIVMHGGIFARILSVLFDVRAERYWFQMNNTGISRIDIREDGRIWLRYMNKVEHLPDDLIT